MEAGIMNELNLLEQRILEVQAQLEYSIEIEDDREAGVYEMELFELEQRKERLERGIC